MTTRATESLFGRARCVIERLEAAMSEEGCLCMYSRCPVHDGEPTALLAASCLSIEEVIRLLRRAKVLAGYDLLPETGSDFDLWCAIVADDDRVESWMERSLPDDLVVALKEASRG